MPTVTAFHQRSDALPKISEQIAVHLSKDQLLDVIKDEVNHLREELDCGINDGVGEWQEKTNNATSDEIVPVHVRDTGHSG